MQEKLKALGFYSGAIDGDFGSSTVAAVKAFQTANGLSADGIVGAGTWKALESAVVNPPTEPVPPEGYPALREGSTGDYVVILQDKLKKLGYFSGSITGVFGATTTQSVKAFQAAKNLTADGIVGKTTWKLLFDDTAVNPPGPTPGTPKPTLRLGDRGPYVEQLQRELKNLMFYQVK